MIEEIMNLIPHILWIGTLVFLVYKFPNLFQEFVSGIKKISISDEGINIERSVKTATDVISEKEGSDNVNSNIIQRDLMRLPPNKRLLWVDDHPEGNMLEAETFESAGITVIKAKSNRDAVLKFAGTEFNIIVSDINRDNGESGLNLSRELCEDRNRIPPIIYYVGNVERPRTDDGYPVISKPSELFQLVGDILRLQNRR